MSKESDFKTLMWIIGGLIVFWLIAIPVVMAGPKLGGAGPQPTSTGSGSGA